MYRYYATPVQRQGRELSVNPLDGACVLADTPYDAFVRLGLPNVGELFAVWTLGRLHDEGRTELDLERAGNICQMLPPSHVYVCLDEKTFLPLGIDATLDVKVEVRRAGSD